MENSQFSVRADDQKHLVFVEGNINSGNAQEFKEKLSAFESRIRDEAYPIDISGLKYITSAGLRVFLQISRKETLCLLNAPRDVYDIFHITGFDRIFNIRKKPEEIHVTLSDLEIIGEGANGKIYQLDVDTVIKVFQETAPLEEIEQERSLAREALVAGIPTAISYSVVSVDGRYGILFEMVHAESLSKVLKSSPSRYDELTDRYVSLFRKIHETEADKRSFPSIKAIYRKAITDCASWYSGEERFHVLGGPEAYDLIYIRNQE